MTIAYLQEICQPLPEPKPHCRSLDQGCSVPCLRPDCEKADFFGESRELNAAGERFAETQTIPALALAIVLILKCHATHLLLITRNPCLFISCSLVTSAVLNVSLIDVGGDRSGVTETISCSSEFPEHEVSTHVSYSLSRAESAKSSKLYELVSGVTKCAATYRLNLSIGCCIAQRSSCHCIKSSITILRSKTRALWKRKGWAGHCVFITSSHSRHVRSGFYIAQRLLRRARSVQMFTKLLA